MPTEESVSAQDPPSQQSLRVLITNRTLTSRSGTELYVAELAHALIARGHSPIIYAPRKGDLAEVLRLQSVVVRSSLVDMHTPPDVIHGHHRVATMTALTRYPGVPVISFAHDFTHPDDVTPAHPSVRRYVAVDDTNRDRLIYSDGIDPNRVEVRLNWFDPKRFLPRGTALPTRPRRALVLSNHAVEGRGYLPILRAACERFDITLDVVGLGVGRPSDAPEAILGNYDIVFAKARAAIEAMATGCATVLCDAAGFGGLVTVDRVTELRRLNFGLRSLRRGYDVDLVAAEIAAYDAADAAAVSSFVRRDADMDTAVDGLVRLYRAVISEARSSAVDEEDDGRAMSTVFEAISAQIIRLEDDGHLGAVARNQLEAERDALAGRLDHAEGRLMQERVRANDATALAESTQRELRSLVDAHRALLHDHKVTVESATFRIRDALAKRHGIVWLWRTLRRSSARDADREGSV